MLSSGQDVAHLLPSDSDIRHIHRHDSPPIGEMRNIGCRHSRGSVICHFDDDDHSDSLRVADQVNRLVESGKAVTGYSAMRFTDGSRWWQYTGGTGYALGTSLMYRRDWWMHNPFPNVQVGEDNEMVMRAKAQMQIISVDAGARMHATIHTGNTSPRNLIGKNWTCLD